MSLIFHYAPNSTATVTEAVLSELAVPCDRVQVAIGPEGTQSATFRRLNPNGRVPVIQHDGLVMWESGAITLYLGETFGVERGLWPPAGPQRGEAMKWVVWANATLAEAGGRLFYALPQSGGDADVGASQDAATQAATQGDAGAGGPGAHGRGGVPGRARWRSDAAPLPAGRGL